MRTAKPVISLMTALAAFFVSTISIADDLNPAGYRGQPASVAGEFDFNDDGMNPSPPTNFNWWEGPAGEVLLNMQPCVAFNPEFFQWQDGSWVNNSPKASQFRIKMPNIIDDFDIKLMHLQITWAFDGKSEPPMIVAVDGADAEDGELSVVTSQQGQTMPLMGAMRHTSYNIFVRPNPDWETIDILVRPGMAIKQVVLDTISIPDYVPGDANGDGKVNLLDVAPFVNFVANGEWRPAIDINQDAKVNLLDVAPFIELLNGG